MAKCVHLTNYQYADNEAAAMRKSLDYMLYFHKNCAEAHDVDKIEKLGCAKE